MFTKAIHIRKINLYFRNTFHKCKTQFVDIQLCTKTFECSKCECVLEFECADQHSSTNHL